MFRLFGLLLTVLLAQSHFSIAIASEGQIISCIIKGSNTNIWSSAVVNKLIQLEIEKYFINSLRPGRAVFHLDGPSAITSVFGPHALRISPQCNNCKSPEHPSHKVKAELFSNGSLNVTKKGRIRFKYECNKNSLEVLALLNNEAPAMNNAASSSTTTHTNTLTDDITGSIWRIYEDNGETTVFHFNQDGTVAYLYLSSNFNQGKTFNDGNDHWSATGNLIEISFGDDYSKMSLKFDNAENRIIGTLVLNSGEIRWIGGHLENKNVKFEEGKFFNLQRPSQKTIDKQIALLKNTPKTQIASSTTIQTKTPTTAELQVSQRKLEELEQQLAALKAEQEQQQQSVPNDTKLPTITIASATAKGAQGIIRGRVNDNTGIAELRLDGQKIAVDSNGNFSATTYVPEGGTSVNIEAIDLAGLSSTMSVRVERAATQTASLSFDRLNPLKRKAAINNDALALVIGVSEYKETNAKAIYADSDAKVFQDYAIEKLGVPRNRVKTLVNDGADEKDMLLATKRWLARAAKQDKTDVYIFFAGHGLASDDGSKMYLLPYDGAPELLDKTAILRDELFADISAANPRSVTVFLDTCYSGTTRGTDMLIASRPIAIRALEQSIPDNFTVMTAAAGDQTAKPLEEAKHGMFSYFLMKGMEGEADANKNNEITAGELHSYVQTNVIQQSSGSQTPELQGDADRVLVRFK